MMQVKRSIDARPTSGRMLVLLTLTLSWIGVTGCDLVVDATQPVTLANDGMVFGTSGGVTALPQPAVRVRRDGQLTVANASLFGGSVIIDGFNGSLGQAAAGIDSDGGRVRVTSGAFVRGGVALLIQSPVEIDLLAGPGIRGHQSTVSIEAGAVVSAGELLADQSQRARVTHPAVFVDQSTLMISGGTLLSARLVLAGRRPALSVLRSLVTVSGGNIESMEASDSTTTITGGVIPQLSQDSGCTEIHGGSLSQLNLTGGTIRIFGSGFNLPFGIVNLSAAEPLRIQGTLESGAPLDVTVVDEFVGLGFALVLGPPGSQPCPPPR